VSVTAQKPQQLVDDRSQVQLFGGHQRKPGAQIEPQLRAEPAQRTDAGPIRFADPRIEHLSQQFQVRFHRQLPFKASLAA
jgi:hypothetical protein